MGVLEGIFWGVFFGLVIEDRAWGGPGAVDGSNRIFYRFSHTSDHFPSRCEHCKFTEGTVDKTRYQASRPNPPRCQPNEASVLTNLATWLPNEDMFRPETCANTALCALRCMTSLSSAGARGCGAGVLLD
jgi:hypothetical protein